MRVERLQQEFAVEMEACAFDLRPGLPAQGLPRDQAYPGRSYPQGYLDHLLKLGGVTREEADRIAAKRTEQLEGELSEARSKEFGFRRLTSLTPSVPSQTTRSWF